MPRPKEEHPTAAELEVLKIIWERGPSTVREVLEVLNERRRRAYTSVMSLLNVMVEKKLLVRKPKGRAFVYHAKAQQEKTLKRMLGDLLSRAFEGSASTLVTHLLDQSRPTAEELEAIRAAIEEYQDQEKSP